MKFFNKLFLLCAAVMLLTTPGWAVPSISYVSSVMTSTDVGGTRTLTLSEDCMMGEAITITGSGDVVIDGAGHTITGNNVRAIKIDAGSNNPDLTVTIQNLTIKGSGDVNEEKDLGGIEVKNANIILKNVIFENNVANEESSSSGGAVYANFLQNATNPYKVSFDNVAFKNNTATSSYGGAIYLDVRTKISVDIHNATFSGNQTHNNNRGGGLYVTGTNQADATVNIVNSSFTGNDASQGGAMYFKGSNAAIKANIVNSTFVNNSAEQGAELYFKGASNVSNDIKIVNTILLNNGETTSDDYFYFEDVDIADVKFIKSLFDPKALSGSLTSSDVISEVDAAPLGITLASVNAASLDTYVETESTDVDSTVDATLTVKHTFFMPKEILAGAGVTSYDGVTIPTDDIIGQIRDSDSITVGAYELPKINYEITTTGSFDVTSGDEVEITFTLSPDLEGAAWSADVTSGDFADIGLTLSGDTITGTAKTGSVAFIMSAFDGDTLLASKDFTITVSEDTTQNESASDSSNPLKSIAVTISGDSSYSFTAGTGGTATLAMTVTGTYSDGTTATLESGDYTPLWTLGTISPDTTAITIAESTGILTVDSSITSGDYTVPVTAKATSGDVSGDVTKNITVTVTAASSTTTDTSDTTVDSKDQTGGTTTPTMNNDGTITVPKGANVADVIKAIAGQSNVVLTAANISNMSGLTTATLLNLLTSATSFASVDLTTVTVAAIDLSGAKIEKLTMAGNTAITSLVLSATSQIPVIKANGTKIATVNLAGNTYIQDLDLSSTDISALDLTGCENVKDLAVAESKSLKSLQGLKSARAKLTKLNIQGCSIIMLNLNGFTALTATNARLGGQTRSGFVAPRKFNWLTDFFFGSWSGQPDSGDDSADRNLDFANIVSVTAAEDASGNIGTPEVTASGDVTFTSAPIRFAYVFNTGVSASSVEELQAADDNAMDVTITATADDSGNTDPGSSGSGCDTGFGILAVSACVALFINRKKH